MWELDRTICIRLGIMAVRMIGCYSYMVYKLVEAFYLKIAMRQSIQNDPSNTLQYNTSTLQYNTSYSCIQ